MDGPFGEEFQECFQAKQRVVLDAPGFVQAGAPEVDGGRVVQGKGGNLKAEKLKS
jgi:hypothetical protein